MDSLITDYRQRLNLHDATFTPICHDDAMIAIVYKITTSTGIQYILKINPREQDYRREVYFLNYFAEKLPVPQILATVPPSAGVNGAVLMEYLPGNILKTADCSAALAYEMGMLLARIHSNKALEYGDVTEPNSLTSDPRIYFTVKFEENIRECRNHLPRELIKKSCDYYEQHVDLLLAVDGPCLIHRDFRPGNVIVNNGKIQGIIDWASARAGFVQDDLCTMEHWEWPTSSSAIKNDFLAGYASVRSVPEYTFILPILRLNRALGTVGFTVKSNTWHTNNACAYKFNRNYLDAFFC